MIPHLPTLPILAEASIDPIWSYNMGLWLVGALSVISTVATIWSIFWGRSKTEVQQPLVVEMQKEFATKDEVREVNNRVTQLDKSVDDRFAATAKSGSESREKLYLRINAIDASMAAVRKEVEIQSVRQTQIETKIDRLLERFADHASKTKEG